MNLIVLVFIYVFLFAFGLSIGIIPLIRSWASSKGVIDHPHKERLHTTPVPLLGGVGIFVAFYLTIIVNLIIIKIGLPFADTWIHELTPYVEGALKNVNKFLIIMFCSSIIFCIGLIDDLKTLGAKRKLLFEIIVGLILYMNGIAITVFGGHYFLNMIMTVIWLSNQ